MVLGVDRSRQMLSQAPRSRCVHYAQAAAGHGFALSSRVCIVQEIAPTPAEYCDRIANGGLSDLTGISDQQFESGLASPRLYCDGLVESLPVQEEVDLFVFFRVQVRRTAR